MQARWYWCGVILVAALSASCGYALAGRGNALPDHIQTIGVPQFANQSIVPDVERVLSDAVRAEFQSKGRYLVRPDESGVDGLLTGTVTSVTLRPTGFTSTNQPSSYEVVVVANVEFKDLIDGDRVLWANSSFRITDDYQVTTSGAAIDTTAIASQGAQSLERVATRFAREIVTSIFEAF